MIRRWLWLIVAALPCWSAVLGQPITYRGEIGAAAATGGVLPFWLHANQSGMIEQEGTSGLVRMQVARTYQGDGLWDVGFGADLVARGSDHTTAYLNQLYAQARLGFLQLRVGRKVEQIGTVDELLSMGSLATSTNATPLPKVVVETRGYTPVPFTRGYAEFKGSFAHAWFGDERYTDRPYLHQKTFYARLGGSLPVNVYAGIVHDAFWAGATPLLGDLPDGFEDYLRTVFGMSGGEDAPGGEQIYVQGNHLGIYDAGFLLRLKGYELLSYRHFIFDDKDGLKLKNPGDGLLGFSLRMGQDVQWLSRVTYEYLYTKRQSGPEPVGPGRDGPGGQDNYYSHYIYRSGWTYFGRTMGSPLLFPFPDNEIRENDRIENNRIVAHHLGLAGQPVPALRYRLLLTYSRNYGTYTERTRVEEGGGTYAYREGLRQYSILVETQTRLPGRVPLEVLAALGWDFGEMYEDTAGVRLGLIYRGVR